MSSEFDAAAAARRATGKARDGSDGAENHADVEGADVDGDEVDLGSERTLRDMLLSTEPDQRLEDVDSPWNPELGGPRRIYRGLQKAAGISGAPAIVDIVIGLAETIVSIGPDDDVDQDGNQDGSDELPSESEAIV